MNEAALWPTQSSKQHPNKTTSSEVLNTSIALAKVVKNIDPSADVFGGDFYGFGEFYDMQGATDWAAIKTANPTYNWYVDYFLDNFKNQSITSGKRLMDVLSFHWYPEAIGDIKIVDKNALCFQ